MRHIVLRSSRCEDCDLIVLAEICGGCLWKEPFDIGDDLGEGIRDLGIGRSVSFDVDCQNEVLDTVMLFTALEFWFDLENRVVVCLGVAFDVIFGETPGVFFKNNQ